MENRLRTAAAKLGRPARRSRLSSAASLWNLTLHHGAESGGP